MFGHIVLISSDESLADPLSQWTVDWLDRYKVPVEKTLYHCTDLKLATASLQIPLQMGHPPSLVIIDHSIDITEAQPFARLLRDCLPEVWIIELANQTSYLPEALNAFVLMKPVCQKDWDDILHHVYVQAITPQWSVTSSNK